MTFDATSREFCTVRRVRTNTPLQALTTLNDPGFFEAARALAAPDAARGGPGAPTAARRLRAFRLRARARDAASRPSCRRGCALYQRQRERWPRAQPDGERALPSTVPAGCRPPVDRRRRAARPGRWSANVLLNLDETLDQGMTP